MPKTARTEPYIHNKYLETVYIVRCEACHRNFELLACSLDYMIQRDILILCAECDVKG